MRNLLRNWRINRLYRSFNVGEIFHCDLTSSQKESRDKMFYDIYPSLRSKRDVENLKVKDIWIGDLLYDSHTMIHKVPTVDVNSESFRKSLRDALGNYVFWSDYLDNHDVRSIIVSHTVYAHCAMGARLAIYRDIPVYQINATSLYYLNKDRQTAYIEFFDYPELFREFTADNRAKALQKAKERLNKRLSGEVGVDMYYSKKSAYKSNRSQRVIRESDRIKVLVATHCFFDCPHPYGMNLFPDFYEWLTFLGEISKKTDYDWYIKTHPDFLPGNIPIINEFIEKYPKFNLLDPNTSHLQIVEEGINFALTVYGTIGFEYPALGVPVITASPCNPRIRYSSNIHPRSVQEYENILMNLSNVKAVIDLDEVYESYYMSYLDNTNDWLFADYENFIRDIGGYSNQANSISYEKYIEQFSTRRHDQILSTISSFIDSKEYKQRNRHVVNND